MPARFFGMSKTKWTGFSYGAVALILLAVWLRLWRLETIPPGLWFDESLNGMEAIWMLKTDTWPVFILRGQGREAMYFYFLALSLAGLGQTEYAIRLVSACLGILSVPLMYRWSLSIFKDHPRAYWLALASTAGLVVSLSYLIMNRVGYRANTLLPVMLFTLYFFWRAWQSGRIRYYALAGLGLGLCQYTYLAGRLVPLIIVVFIGGYLLLIQPQSERSRLMEAWPGLLLMTGLAALIVTPLILFFLNYPELFGERSGDVSLKIEWTGPGLVALGQHILSAVRVFIDGQDPNWRHHLLGRPVFDGLSVIGFWVGLFVALRHFRQPNYLFLLVTLVVMWLPAILSESSLHTLRLVGTLPAYYALMAIGLFRLAEWGQSRLRLTHRQVGWGVLLTVLLLSGGLNGYDYFFRWARRAEVYQAFDGSVVALAQKLITTREPDVIIPFYLYTHASMRYLLNEHFQETGLTPTTELARLKSRERMPLIIPDYPPDDGHPPAFVWLTQDADGVNKAYISAIPRGTVPANSDVEADQLIQDEQGQVIARQYQVETKQFFELFPSYLPEKEAAAVWADNLSLIRYEFKPPIIEGGETTHLFLAWQILGYTGLEEKMFLQLLNSQGEPVGQQEFRPISRKMYRWRDDGWILETYPLSFGSDLEAGLYFVRLGFFDPDSNRRLSLYHPGSNRPLGDELIVGPLYVKRGDHSPNVPEHPVSAMVGDEFEFLGYSIYTPEFENRADIELFWSALDSVETDYTVFVQLLDPENQIISQVDAQPLGNVYPTSRWQPGDVISARYSLPIPDNISLDQNRLITGMYDFETGMRLPTYNNNYESLPEAVIQLTEEKDRQP